MRIIPFQPGQSDEIAAQQQNSVGNVVNGNIEITSIAGYDSNGWPNVFQSGNIRGNAIRVSATGTTPPSGGVNWTSANTKIPHGLGKLPTGFILCYKDKPCDIYAGTTKPDNQFVYLTITDDTANTTILVF